MRATTSRGYALRALQEPPPRASDSHSESTSMPRFAANLSMLFTELPFLDRFEAAASAGFKGVEFLFPYDYEADDLAARLKANGLEQVLFNLPAGNWNAGERGIAIYPNTVDEFRDSVASAIRYAKVLGCTRLHCLAGTAPATADHRACARRMSTTCALPPRHSPTRG